MRHLPFPIRVAAGLAVTTVERARELPKQLTEFPVTAVSQVLHASMRVQQQVTELAIKGDDALSSLQRPEEEPEWVTFDEDDEAVGEPGGRSGAEARGFPAGTPSPARSASAPSTSLGDADDLTEADDPWSLEERALAEDHTDGEFDSPAIISEPAGSTDAESADPEDGPGGIAGYDELSLPQVRSRLRTLTPDQLEELLAYERAHANRPSFTGMLARRVSNARDEASPSDDSAQQ